MTTTIMTNSTETPFEQFLAGHDEEAWAAALTTLLRSVHEVDKNATQIWFSFFPLSLFCAFEATDDPDLLAAQLLVRGVYPLKEQVDSSHKFLYGHRYWPEVKKAVEALASNFAAGDTGGLSDQNLKLAREVAQSRKNRESLTVGSTCLALITVPQAGPPAVQDIEGHQLLHQPDADEA